MKIPALAWGLPVAVLAALLAADLAAFLLRGSLLDRLGPIAGLELGLLIFLNLLGLLLLLDLAAERCSLPGLGWFRRLEARWPSRQERSGSDSPGARERALAGSGTAPAARLSRAESRWILLLPAQLLGLALLFYILEAFLLPFLPPVAGVQYELLLVGGIFIWRLFPSPRDSGR